MAWDWYDVQTRQQNNSKQLSNHHKIRNNYIHVYTCLICVYWRSLLDYHNPIHWYPLEFRYQLERTTPHHGMDLLGGRFEGLVWGRVCWAKRNPMTRVVPTAHSHPQSSCGKHWLWGVTLLENTAMNGLLFQWFLLIQNVKALFMITACLFHRFFFATNHHVLHRCTVYDLNWFYLQYI